MIKLVVLVKRHADLSLADFIARYEGRHAPFAQQHVSRAVRYERRYLTPLSAAPDADDPLAYDVMTELWYDDHDTMMADLRHMSSPDVARAIAADEEDLFDTATRRTYVVAQEAASTIG